MELGHNVRVKIIGAGSIGNHLCHAARSLGWEVFVTDIDSRALDRMRTEVYPQRYGSWDLAINLTYPGTSGDLLGPQVYDVIFVCTPPSTHLDIALSEILQNKPKFLFIEKPLSNPSSLKKLYELKTLAIESNTTILVGYNHRLTPNTYFLTKIIHNNDFGKVNFIRSNFRENWIGILKAHPWLDGPSESYLGSIQKGGGALFEHSHGLDLLLYVKDELGFGEPKIKSIVFERKKDTNLDYDKNSILVLEFTNGVLALLEQNVFTNPPIKILEIEYEKARMVWFTENHTAGVRVYDEFGEVMNSFVYNKNRMDDFKPEIEHISSLLKGESKDSPIFLSKIVGTQLLLEEAFKEITKNK